MYDDCRKIFNDKGAYRKHALTHGEKQVSNYLLISTLVLTMVVEKNF